MGQYKRVSRLDFYIRKKADPSKSVIVVDSVTGPQLRNPCNCLPKTQVSANTKVDV